MFKYSFKISNSHINCFRISFIVQGNKFEFLKRQSIKKITSVIKEQSILILNDFRVISQEIVNCTSWNSMLSSNNFV